MRVSSIAEIRSAVADIASAAGDDETAHSLEDQLHQAVLTAIANGEHDDEARLMAHEALKTSDIKFSRWCA